MGLPLSHCARQTPWPSPIILTRQAMASTWLYSAGDPCRGCRQGSGIVISMNSRQARRTRCRMGFWRPSARDSSALGPVASVASVRIPPWRCRAVSQRGGARCRDEGARGVATKARAVSHRSSSASHRSSSASQKRRSAGRATFSRGPRSSSSSSSSRSRCAQSLGPCRSGPAAPPSPPSR